MSQEDADIYRTIRFYVTEGMTVTEAAEEIGVTYQKANFLITRGKVTAAILRERRKSYIEKRLMDKRTAYRHTPHVIACYFKVDESYIDQLVRELRAEGRLPPLTEKDKEWQDDLLQMLRRRFSMVCRAETINKQDKHPGQIYVAGKGFLDWQGVANLAGVPLPSQTRELRQG